MNQRIPISKVKPGMILSMDVINHNGGVLLKKGVMLTDKTIQILFNKYSISEVVVKYEHNGEAKNNNHKMEIIGANPQRYTNIINQLNHLDSTGLLDMIKNDAIKVGKMMLETNFIQHTKKVESIFFQAIDRTEILELLLKFRVISENGREHFNRYIKTSLLATAIGINLNLSNSELVLLARAALLYDIGNCLVDQNLLNSDYILPKNEKKKLNEHVIIGFQILQEKFPKEISLPAYQHHERFDGSGYPNGLKNNDLHLFSRIIAVVDVYTALSYARPHRPAYPTSEIIELLLGSGDILFDYKIISEFLEVINIYAEGSLVLLNNGDVGIVTEIKGKPIGKPVVKLIYDKKWRSLHGKEIDLSTNNLYFIKKVID